MQAKEELNVRVFKLIGSGPMADLCAYAEVKHMDICTDYGVVLQLDEPQALPSGKSFETVTVNKDTGACIIGGSGDAESDLIHVATFDLPRLWEAQARWFNYDYAEIMAAVAA